MKNWYFLHKINSFAHFLRIFCVEKLHLLNFVWNFELWIYCIEKMTSCTPLVIPRTVALNQPSIALCWQQIKEKLAKYFSNHLKMLQNKLNYFLICFGSISFNRKSVFWQIPHIFSRILSRLDAPTFEAIFSIFLYICTLHNNQYFPPNWSLR